MGSEIAKDKLKAVWDKLEAAINDLSSLEVTTISGELTLAIQSTGTGNNTKTGILTRDGLLNLVKESAANGKLYIVAHTRIELDQDRVDIVKQGMDAGDEKLYQLHVESVKAAQEARASFVSMLVSLVNG